MKDTRFLTALLTTFMLGLAVEVGTAQPADQPQAAPSGPAQAAGEGRPKMELSPLEFDFGQVWVGAPAKQEFTIKNVGSAPLTITAKSSCGCTVATKPKSPLAPGESTTFSITYNTSRKGVANKKVTLTTNDPAQPKVIIPVKGEVKPLFKRTPEDTLRFLGIDENAKETRTLRLENQFDKPIHLKLAENNPDFKHFKIELKEIEPGQVYELAATTVPPLNKGANHTVVRLDTGVEPMKVITIPVLADVRPPVFVTPRRLIVSDQAKRPIHQMLQVQYRSDKPVQVKEVKASLPMIKVELLPQTEEEARRPIGVYRVKVDMDDGSALPPEGGVIEIYTDSSDPQCRKLEVPVIKRSALMRNLPRPTTRPAKVNKVKVNKDEIRKQIEEAMKKAQGKGHEKKPAKPNEP